MIEKVNAFPMEDLYYLESQDFLVDRESVYLKKNKSMKLNSFWLGVSKLRVNNDKLLFLFNGLRGYYDVRSRYFKEPKVFEKRVPFSKKILVNEYFVNKYKYSDMLIYSLNYLNRPTITIKKEEGVMHYSFPSRLVEYINKKREIINAVEANKEFYKDIRMIKNIGYRFYLNPRRRNKGFRKIKFLNSIALGLKESFLTDYSYYLQEKTRNLRKVRSIIPVTLYFRRKRRFVKFNRFYKTPNYIRILFILARKFVKGNFIKKPRRKRLKKN